MTEDVFISEDKNDSLARLEKCYNETLKGDVIMKKIKEAISLEQLNKNSDDLLGESLKAKIITKSEKKILEDVQKLQLDVVEVDSFMINDYLNHKMKTPYV